MVNELELAPFQVPAGWTPLPIDRTYPALYRLTRRGNLEVAVDLSRQIRGARAATRMVAIRAEESKEILGRAGRPGSEFAATGREPGMEGTLPEEYARMVVPSRPGALYETPALTELGMQPIPAPPIRYRRREFGVALVAAEAVEAYRSYLARLPTDRRTQRDFLHGAAYAVYTSYLNAPVLGFFVQSLQGGLAHDIPTAPVVGQGLRPSQVEPEDAFPLETPRGAMRAPAFYHTIAALIYAVNGANEFRLELPEFDNMMRDIGWTPCGRVPRSELFEWCPPLAASIVPELPPQQQLMEGAPPVVYPTHASPTPPPRPSYYRSFSPQSEQILPERYVPGEMKRRAEKDRAFRNAVIEQARKRRAGRQKGLE
jgi:hypothetical protein